MGGDELLEFPQRDRQQCSDFASREQWRQIAERGARALHSDAVQYSEVEPQCTGKSSDEFEI